MSNPHQTAIRNARQAMIDMWRTHSQTQADGKQEKRHKRSVYHQCSYCGKDKGETLRACSLCRSVRYCDKNCQNADYKSRHRDECNNFVYPPFTTAFLTEPIGNAKFPQAPIFAHAHQDGAGCWVSIHGNTEVKLMTPINVMRMKSPKEVACRHGVAAEKIAFARSRKIWARSLLTLSVLVQNRRKDKKRIITFAAQAQIVSYNNTVEDVMRGRGEGDNMFTFQSDIDATFATMCVAKDVVTNEPRLQIMNFNGTDLKDKAPPREVLNAERGIISLSPGEYAIFEVQFRIGDGERISTDYEAVGSIQALCFPCLAPWEGQSVELLDHDLTEHFAGPGRSPVGLRAKIDHKVVDEYYSDFHEGELAFLESHHGKERSNAWKQKQLLMFQHGSTMLQNMEVLNPGGLERDLKRYEQAGLQSPLRIAEALRNLRTG